MSDPRLDRDLGRSDLDRDRMAQGDRQPNLDRDRVTQGDFRSDFDRDRMAHGDLVSRPAKGDSGTWIAAAVVAILLAGGIAYFALSGDRQTAGTAPDTTTGQTTRPAPAPSPAPQR